MRLKRDLPKRDLLPLAFLAALRTRRAARRGDRRRLAVRVKQPRRPDKTYPARAKATSPA
jgi:hypothetical protein